MQGALTFRHYGKTRTVTSRSTSRLTLEQTGRVFMPPVDKTTEKEFKIFPSLFLPRDGGAVWLPHIAANLFAAQADMIPKQTNPLQYPTHFPGFFKAVLAIPKFSTLFLQETGKTNKLNCLPAVNGVLRTIYARLPSVGQRRGRLAAGIFNLVRSSDGVISKAMESAINICKPTPCSPLSILWMVLISTSHLAESSCWVMERLSLSRFTSEPNCFIWAVYPFCTPRSSRSPNKILTTKLS